MIYFISREQVLAVCKHHGATEVAADIEKLFSFPAPNPQEKYGRNIMGQTEDEFWDAVDAAEEQSLESKWQ